MRIHKNDTVEVITGKQNGTRGLVETVDPQSRRLIVVGVNIIKRHQKARGGKGGGIIEKPAPVDISNVMLICPKCSVKTRVGYIVSNEKKHRVCKQCRKEID